MIKKESNLIITIIIINFYRDVGIALICFWSTTNRNGRRLCEARNDLHRSCRCSRKQVDASVGTFACIRTPRLCCSVKVRILCRSRNILRRRDRWNGSLKKKKRNERGETSRFRRWLRTTSKAVLERLIPQIHVRFVFPIVARPCTRTGRIESNSSTYWISEII